MNVLRVFFTEIQEEWETLIRDKYGSYVDSLHLLIQQLAQTNQILMFSPDKQIEFEMQQEIETLEQERDELLKAQQLAVSQQQTSQAKYREAVATIASQATEMDSMKEHIHAVEDETQAILEECKVPLTTSMRELVMMLQARIDEYSQQIRSLQDRNSVLGGELATCEASLRESNARIESQDFAIDHLKHIEEALQTSKNALQIKLDKHLLEMKETRSTTLRMTQENNTLRSLVRGQIDSMHKVKHITGKELSAILETFASLDAMSVDGQKEFLTKLYELFQSYFITIEQIQKDHESMKENWTRGKAEIVSAELESTTLKKRTEEVELLIEKIQDALTWSSISRDSMGRGCRMLLGAMRGTLPWPSKEEWIRSVHDEDSTV
eukprot:PhF_6_TR2343/c0_g1_i3/m.4197